MTMTAEVKERLKSIPKARCKVCNTSRTYSNPMARCFNCNAPFCYDHIYGSWARKGQDSSKEVQNICESCLGIAPGYLL
jgi:hypothetical protein